MNFSDTSSSLSLQKLRETLIRLEDSVVFGLIERAQYAANSPVYAKTEQTRIPIPDWNGSFLDYFLHETEKIHAKVRRYTAPDEYAFTPILIATEANNKPLELPSPILSSLDYPPVLHANNININRSIYDLYINEVVPRITANGDDGNYGSSATRDVEVLQNLSRRIHLGKFVAEAKFLDQTNEYTTLIEAKDRQGIYTLLTNKAVEEKLLTRVKKKALVYGQDIDGDEFRIDEKQVKLNQDLVALLYEQWIIPLTKEVETDYLLQRLNK